MKLDITELERGIQEEFEKNAAVNWQGIGRLARPVVDFTKYSLGNMGSAIKGVAKSYPKATGAAALGAAGLYGTDFGKGVRAAGRMVKDTVGGATDVAGEVTRKLNPQTNDPKSQEAPLSSTLEQGADFLKNIRSNAAAAGGYFPYIQNLVSQGWDKGNEFFKNQLGEYGQYAMPALGIGAALMGANALFGKRKKRPFGQGGPGNININIGGQSRLPGLLDYHGNVGSLSSPSTLKYGSVKKAAVIDAIGNATKTRLANKLIDKVMVGKQQEAAQSKEKELEIVSKYPEMAKLLEDEQNKAYLQKLMKE
jgi:hypothetical protein